MLPALGTQDTRRCTLSSCAGLASSPNLRLGSSCFGRILCLDILELQMFLENERLLPRNSQGLVRLVRRLLSPRIRRAIVRLSRVLLGTSGRPLLRLPVL